VVIELLAAVHLLVDRFIFAALFLPRRRVCRDTAMTSLDKGSAVGYRFDYLLQGPIL
jgi:hypothetical protein